MGLAPIGRHVKAQIILQLNVLPNIPLGQGQASGINLQWDLRPHRVKHTPGIRIGFVMKKQSIARDLFDRMHSSLPNSDDGGITVDVEDSSSSVPLLGLLPRSADSRCHSLAPSRQERA